MVFNEKNKTKYPKSSNGYQCLTPCYKAGIFAIHPITLNQITDPANPFCLIEGVEETNKITGEIETKYTDKCFNPVDEKITNKYELSMNMITPKIGFTDENFLKIYYKIYSFENALEWLNENINSPFYTKQRILDCSWKIWGFNTYSIDDRLILFYLDLFKNNWFNNVFLSLKKYFENKNKDEIKNIINKKLLNYENLSKFFDEYIEKQAKIKDEILSHTNNIKNLFIEYLRKKIELSL